MHSHYLLLLVNGLFTDDRSRKSSDIKSKSRQNIAGTVSGVGYTAFDSSEYEWMNEKADMINWHNNKAICWFDSKEPTVYVALPNAFIKFALNGL